MRAESERGYRLKENLKKLGNKCDITEIVMMKSNIYIGVAK